MRLFGRARLIAACAIAIGAGLSMPARAAAMPTGSTIRVERGFDVAAFARLVATRDHVVLHRVVTADIDRDGDLDVLASTDRGFLVWVNDGAGRLTSQPPAPHPAIDGDAPSDTWSGARSHDEETIQNELPSLRVPGEHSQAPPLTVSQTAVRPDVAPPGAALRDESAPRAPPPLV